MFNLTRYFSMVCLLVMFIGAISLGAGYRALELKNLCSIGEENNNAITRSISKYVWPQYAQLIPRENSQQSYNIDAIAPAFGDSIKQLIGGTGRPCQYLQYPGHSDFYQQQPEPETKSIQ